MKDIPYGVHPKLFREYEKVTMGLKAGEYFPWKSVFTGSWTVYVYNGPRDRLAAWAVCGESMNEEDALLLCEAHNRRKG